MSFRLPSGDTVARSLGSPMQMMQGGKYQRVFTPFFDEFPLPLEEEGGLFGLSEGNRAGSGNSSRTTTAEGRWENESRESLERQQGKGEGKAPTSLVPIGGGKRGVLPIVPWDD